MLHEDINCKTKFILCTAVLICTGIKTWLFLDLNYILGKNIPIINYNLT